jgi:GT2 family glycosyltransferase/glycosyltransferase involved in cell wall biosynthesis
LAIHRSTMPPLRVLYVTERFDGPYRYRCQQACEQLRADGAVANVAHIDDGALVRELPRYGAVVLFRLPWSERVETVVFAARRAGLPVLFDVDDLVFDPTLDELMPFRKRYGPREWAQTYGRQMTGLRRTLDNADAFIGSTPELALHAARLGKKSHVHRNVVPEYYLASGLWTERIRRALRTRPTIGYFSGSDTHDEDFASIAPALVRALGSSPDARLLIVGYLDLSGSSPEIERRIVRLPYMHWRDFALAYAACHVTLAPLAARNAFTDSKSALKFFEAGAFFTPTVATPVAEMTASISHGETGFLATTEDEWTAAVRSALAKETSARIGRAARLAVERGHSMASARGTLRAIVELYAVEPAGPPPNPSPLDPPNETGRSGTLDRVLRTGRATRDIIRVVRAARRAPRPEIDRQKLIGADGAVAAMLEQRPAVSERDVDIVVPVWNAKNLVLKCLASVVTHARGSYRLVVVDDASTDAELLPALETFARQHEQVIVLRNSENLGFVGTANRGIVHAGARDVLLLNSDTEVFAGFLERLRRVAYSESKVGMVSPLSNNATICSVPEFCRENGVPEGMTAAEMAAMVALSSEGRRPEIVTPHGFCLYLRRDCLDDIGVLDEERFGRGFGEENDLGERAKNGGWKILLADDVYVWHAGKASFGDTGKALERSAQDTLERRHPGYHAAVATFIRKNPLAPVHADLRRHLARGSHRTTPAPLFVLHTTPFSGALGGVAYCVRDLLRATALPRAVLAYPEGGTLEVAEIFGGEMDRPSRYRFPLSHPPERFCHEHPEAVRTLDEILALYRIGWAHVHHLMFLPLSAGRLLQERGIPYAVTVHDFYLACPSFNLLDLSTATACCPRSCGDASRTAACQRALFTAMGETAPPDPVLFVERHRRLSADLLHGSVRVLFPSPSTQRLTNEILPLDEKRAAIVPHGFEMRERERTPQRDDSVLRVAIVGQVAYASKGAAAYLRTMALTAGASIEWHVFGPTALFGFEQKLAALRSRVRVVQHGGYDRAQIVGLIRDAGIDLALLLPPSPETFSYTLSELEAAGVPVVARRIGALADRLEGARHAILVDDPESAALAIMQLAKNRDLLRRMAEGTPVPGGMETWAEYHLSLYAECASLSAVRGPRTAAAIDYRRLNELAIASDSVGGRNVSVTRPASTYTTAWWYSYAERAKPYAPEFLRHIVRRWLAQDKTRPIVRFRLPGRRARLGQQLTLDQRYVSTALLTSHGGDPQIFLDLSPLDPKKIHLIRFNLWCECVGAIHARLYFRHQGARDFDESHSITFSLDGRAATWQEYAVRLDESENAQAWYEGGPIDALRFDPIDREGPVGVGELALCEIRGP